MELNSSGRMARSKTTNSPEMKCPLNEEAGPERLGLFCALFAKKTQAPRPVNEYPGKNDFSLSKTSSSGVI